IDADGRPTAHGHAIAKLPLPPRLAHMLIAAGERGWGMLAAEAAVLLTERGLGGNDADLEARLRRWRGERGKRAEAARGLARRWAASASAGQSSADDHLGACVALGFPDRLAKRRGADGADWISVGGRGFKLDPLSPLAREPWLAVAETQGMAAGARILAAAPIAETDVEALFADRITLSVSVSFDPATAAVSAMRERRLGAIVLSRGPADAIDPEALAAALMEGVRSHSLAL